MRNVPTNIRNWGGGTERHGNSIFIFEIANLCIAHLGHLHHTLTQQQLNEIGRVDVVLVPVDGSYTLDLEGMIEVLHALKAPLMIPMHYFSSLHARPLPRPRPRDWDVEVAEVPSVVSRRRRCRRSRSCWCCPATEFPEPIADCGVCGGGNPPRDSRCCRLGAPGNVFPKGRAAVAPRRPVRASMKCGTA